MSQSSPIGIVLAVPRTTLNLITNQKNKQAQDEQETQHKDLNIGKTLRFSNQAS
jgi:hypothetical protein